MGRKKKIATGNGWLVIPKSNVEDILEQGCKQVRGRYDHIIERAITLDTEDVMWNDMGSLGIENMKQYTGFKSYIRTRAKTKYKFRLDVIYKDGKVYIVPRGKLKGDK